MARRPRRSAKRPTPRPARRPSAGAPAKHGLPGLARRLEREGDAARRARQGRVRDTVAAAHAEIRQRVDFGHKLWWLATGKPAPLEPDGIQFADGEITFCGIRGEPMPLELEEIRAAAVRGGLSPDAVLAGDFTVGDVTTLMVGKRLAAADAVHDRVRVVEAEAADDDEYAWATEHFDRTDWRILGVCVEQGFTDRASAKPTHRITQFVMGTGGRPASGHCGDLRRHFDFLRARGFLACRRGVGTFATQKAIAVCKARDAERTPAGRMASQE